MNSTFVNVESLRRLAGEPTVQIHPSDAAHRGIVDGQWVTIFNDRGTSGEGARGGDGEAGRGRLAGRLVESLHAGRRQLQHHDQRGLTDLGGGATFFDNLVEVAPT